ncbi:hypothetical protein [Roseomonas sp. USHLN139]|uniref:hypothetical protein n=1 Tax=Roseomonas sp. USHLN139 TaxID=3081298 RepID=UPI003B02877B
MAVLGFWAFCYAIILPGFWLLDPALNALLAHLERRSASRRLRQQVGQKVHTR